MATGTVQEPESGQLLVAFQVPPSSFEEEQTDIIAFRLWRRGNNLDMLAEECGYCKGEAQKCLAICR